MSSFIIEGGRKLSGSIKPQGSKNEALQIISATLLTKEEIRISNIPEISDVKNLISLLETIGVEVQRYDKGDYGFKAENLDQELILSSKFVEMCSGIRGSIMLAGPLLARFGRVYIPKPGGDQIGRKKVDTHIIGFLNLGVQQLYDSEKKAFLLYLPEGKTLSGGYILLDEASVTGTANILMASAFAKGETIIYNAACEPYIQQLCRLLIRMGAEIHGIGSNLLRITGVERLHGACHTILPDMIEIGSFIALAAICRSSITIKDISYNDLGIIPDTFRKLGIRIELKGNDLYIPEQEEYVIDSFLDGSILQISDAPWPGLSPDLLGVILVVATQCRGSILLYQKMFESRFYFVDNLIDMGAQIILCDPHRAVVIGNDHQYQLRAKKLSSPDIRAGMALLIAALSASGTSVISNAEFIDYSYEDIVSRLNMLGAKIIRQ